MKIILSRKGFDSSAGGRPSPIYEDKFISIPIPEAESGIRYRELAFNEEHNYLKVMKDLGIKFFTEAHLDPDLRRSVLSDRDKDWRPIFGQDDKAMGVLAKIDKGDLFLFFGLFDFVEKNKAGKFSYVGKKPIHAIFGYLKVGEKLTLKEEHPPKWAEYHPHVVLRHQYPDNNTLFIADEENGNVTAGFFEYNENLVLTMKGKSCSIWKLPKIFEGEKNNFKAKISLSSFSDEYVELSTIGRTHQEFFISESQDIQNWANNLIANCKTYE